MRHSALRSSGCFARLAPGESTAFVGRATCLRVTESSHGTRMSQRGRPRESASGFGVHGPMLGQRTAAPEDVTSRTGSAAPGSRPSRRPQRGAPSGRGAATSGTAPESTWWPAWLTQYRPGGRCDGSWHRPTTHGSRQRPEPAISCVEPWPGRRHSRAPVTLMFAREVGRALAPTVPRRPRAARRPSLTRGRSPCSPADPSRQLPR